ncbi:hypothetical protein HGB13_01250 [bacterium]|nr:hypothetical protein [bacterium]
MDSFSKFTVTFAILAVLFGYFIERKRFKEKQIKKLNSEMDIWPFGFNKNLFLSIIVFLLTMLSGLFSYSSLINFSINIIATVYVILPSFLFYFFYIYYLKKNSTKDKLNNFNKLFFRKLLPPLLVLPVLVVNAYGIVSWNLFKVPTILSIPKAEACVSISSDVLLTVNLDISDKNKEPKVFNANENSFFGYVCDSIFIDVIEVRGYYICENGKWVDRVNKIYADKNFKAPSGSCK